MRGYLKFGAHFSLPTAPRGYRPGTLRRDLHRNLKIPISYSLSPSLFGRAGAHEKLPPLIAQTHHDKINTQPIILQSLWNINAASSDLSYLFDRRPHQYIYHCLLKKVTKITITGKGARPRASPPPDAPSY